MTGLIQSHESHTIMELTPPSYSEHDPINLWLSAVGYELHGVKIDYSKLPGKMLVDFAAFYESESSH